MKNHPFPFLLPNESKTWLSKGVEGLSPSSKRTIHRGANEWMEEVNETLRQVRAYEYQHASH
jgi:hypothetical protein